MKYTVTQLWGYTVKVDVEAESEKEASDKADNMAGDRQYDDYLIDATAKATP